MRWGVCIRGEPPTLWLSLREELPVTVAYRTHFRTKKAAQSAAIVRSLAAFKVAKVYPRSFAPADGKAQAQG